MGDEGLQTACMHVALVCSMWHMWQSLVPVLCPSHSCLPPSPLSTALPLSHLSEHLYFPTFPTCPTHLQPLFTMPHSSPLYTTQRPK